MVNILIVGEIGMDLDDEDDDVDRECVLLVSIVLVLLDELEYSDSRGGRDMFDLVCIRCCL